MTPASPGPVEVGVEEELARLTEACPGLAQVALALARLMDDPRAVNQQPAAAKVLASMLTPLLVNCPGAATAYRSMERAKLT